MRRGFLEGEDLDARELLRRAEEDGVTYVPGVDFGGPANSLRLAFSFVDVSAISDGIGRLAALVPASASASV